jgi:hypothetical protein
MSANKEQTFGDIPYTMGVQITNADGTNKKDLAIAAEAGAGLRVDFIQLVSDLAASQDVELFLFDGTTTQSLGTVTVTAGAGKSGSVPPVEAIGKILADSLGMKAGDKLQIGAITAITAGRTIWATALGVDLTAH